MRMKAILFDLGNTLVKYDVGSPEEVFRRVLASLGISRSVDEIKMATLDAEREAKSLNLLSSFGQMKCEEYWRKWDALVLKHLNIVRNEELAKAIQSRWFDFVDCTPYPEVKEVLSRLKQKGLNIGLVSTAYEEEITLILEKANLEKKLFDIIVGVDTIKKVKPHPDVFRYAIKMLEVKPEETMFIGDSLDADYRGARNVGVNAILLNRRANKEVHDLKTITNLKEIFVNIS